MSETEKTIPSDSDENKKERKRLFEKFRDENTELRQKSFEQFDKAVLTFSGGGLALSISFIKDIVPLESLVSPCLLFISWGCFVIAILSTLYSFKTSPKGIDESINAAEDYYLNYNADAFNRTDANVKKTRLLNTISWWMFLGGMVLTVIFAMINLTASKETLMFKKTAGQEPTKMEMVNNGLEPTKMQKTKVSDGAEATKMQKAPDVNIRGSEPTKMPSAPKPASNQDDSGSTGNASNNQK